MEEIMDCPVCGGRAVIEDSFQFGDGGGCYVYCGHCGHSTVVKDGVFDTEAKAIHDWNNRCNEARAYISEQVDAYLAKLSQIEDFENYIYNTRPENYRFMVKTIKKFGMQKEKLTIDQPDSVLWEYDTYFGSAR